MRRLPNIMWLLANGCDLSQPLAMLSTNLRSDADSSRITGFADTFDALGRAR